ncbi:MAG: hypothetical protein EBR27_11485 [Betaproteobacteria bacterium]|nr:hypothetical protein [Betaproteobacteria bacterium]
MITCKSGVPGSGKTLSMVAELLANSKLAEPRPVYTNITGLSIPHVLMENWEPNTQRREGVLYTIDWRQCPVGSLVVIDEAFLYGYDNRSAQASVPDYIRDLAVHRKDYSVDLVFIAQHPKLLHVALRRQIGKHQHYRRLFGWGRAVVYEWDQCQDNLGATKTAVVSQFSYPRDVFKAYKSAELHTKPKFKLPWFVWIPVALLPLAAWALPAGYSALHGSMSGKGLQSSQTVQAAANKPPAAAGIPVPAGAPEGFVPVGVGPSLPMPGQTPATPLAVAPVPAGCIVTPKGCGCFDAQGGKMPPNETMCEALKTTPPPVQLASGYEVSYYRPPLNVQTVADVFGVKKPVNAHP